MSMREVAKHLSAMGRHGDTTLVHMSPQEVSALHGIAAINGTHLTHNPHTGLPEAFSLGGFFRSLLPTIVGAVAAPLTGGASLLPSVLAGAATGAALNGGNPLMGALTGGLGGFGGAGIGQALGAAGSAGTAASTAAPTVSTAMESGAVIPGADAMSSASAIGKTTSFVPETAAASSTPTTLSGMGQGISNLGSQAGRDAFVKSLGGTGPNADLIAAGKVGLPLAMAGLSGIEPPKPPEEDKYDPNFRLNLSGDSGLRFYAEGGEVFETPDPDSDPRQDARDANAYGLGGIAGYANGGNVGLFGNSSLNLSSEDVSPTNRNVSRLEYLINRNSRNNVMPSTPGLFANDSGVKFARGGYLDGPGDGMSDSIPATIEGKQPARLADGEFVVPADVVSHLGNGSTKAGAQRLYSMMDKVRKARTGSTKQGRQINPNKYMPA